MSKYRILSVPDVSPGKCANCGSTKQDGRLYIDFGLHVEWYGALFLCSYCISEVAEKLGLFDKLRNALAKANDIKKNIEDLRSESKDLHDTVTSTSKRLEEFYVGVSAYRSDSTSNASDNLGIGETGSSKSGLIETEPGIVESSHGAGSKDIRSLADLLNDPRD